MASSSEAGKAAASGDAKDATTGAPKEETTGAWLASMAEKVQDAVEDAVDDAKDRAQDAVAYAQDGMAQITTALAPQINAFDTLSKKFRGEVDSFLRQECLNVLLKVIDQLPAMIKSSLNKDPDTIQWMWKKQCKALDAAWPTFRKELVIDLQESLGMTPELPFYAAPTRSGPWCFRRYFRYRLFPHDRSRWGKLRTPEYWLFLFCFLNPISFISASAFLFWFLLIDKTDEYQLIQFILSNKATVFLSQGFLRTFIGYFTYFNCITSNAKANQHTCDKNGVGMWFPVWLTLSGWVFQIALAWFAATLLPCTKPNTVEAAKALLGHDHPDEDKLEESKGEAADEEAPPDQQTVEEKDKAKKVKEELHRRTQSVLQHLKDQDNRNMQRLVFYDTIVSTIVLAFLGWQIYTIDNWDHFLVRQMVFVCQVTYGYLCIPFLIVFLPGARKMMLHCKKTAYDKEGRCVFWVGPTVERPPSTYSFSLSLEDTNGLLGKVMSRISGEETPIDSHELEAIDRPRVECDHCHVKMRNARESGKKCKLCRIVLCNNCCETEVHCSKKDKDGKTIGSSSGLPHEEDAEESVLARYLSFSSLYTFSSSVYAALASAQSASDSDKLGVLIKTWVKKMSNKHMESMVDRIPEIIMWMAEDPDMPLACKRLKDKAVMAVWTDLREEILYSCQAMLEAPLPTPPDKDPRPGVDCVRSRIRYAEMPYNKSIYWQLKQPTWYLMRIIPLIPWGGVPPFFFLLVLLAINKKDEYQLVNFIFLFKGTLFISHGIVKGILGFYMYTACMSMDEHRMDGDSHLCATAGPGVASGINNFWVLFGAWILCIVLVWVAFLMLPCSKDLGRVKFEKTEEEQEAEKTLSTEAEIADDSKSKKSKADADGGLQAGGKIRWLLLWDMLVFFSCMSVMIWLLVERGNDWVTQQSLFACQVMYGLGSFPFLMFNIPVIREAFSHSIPTGYDSKGRIRALEAPDPKDPELLEQQNKWLIQEQRRLEGLPELPEEDEESMLDPSFLLKKVRQLFSEMLGFGGGDDNEKDKKDDKDKNQGVFGSFISKMTGKDSDEAPAAEKSEPKKEEQAKQEGILSKFGW